MSVRACSRAAFVVLMVGCAHGDRPASVPLHAIPEDPLGTAWHTAMEALAAARVSDPVRGGPPFPAQASPLPPFTGVSRASARYVGDGTCAACHASAARALAQTSHATALATLRAASAAANPACFPCHVTGYGHPGGWVGSRAASMPPETTDLGHVGCEACHGPGSDHVAQPETAGAYGGLPADGSACVACHTHDTSPDFRWEARWPRIAHGREGT